MKGRAFPHKQVKGNAREWDWKENHWSVRVKRLPFAGQNKSRLWRMWSPGVNWTSLWWLQLVSSRFSNIMCPKNEVRNKCNCWTFCHTRPILLSLAPFHQSGRQRRRQKCFQRQIFKCLQSKCLWVLYTLNWTLLPKWAAPCRRAGGSYPGLLI